MSISIHELLAVARESEGVKAVQGDAILCEKRFAPDTRYMVEFLVLEQTKQFGEAGIYHRYFLTKKASPHMLRHYFANARRKDGWKLEMISQALGHRNIETTMKYLNITEDELIEVSDAFYNKHQAMYGVQNLL